MLTRISESDDAQQGRILKRTDHPWPVETVTQTFAVQGHLCSTRCTEALATHGTVLFDLGGLLWCEWKEGIATG